MNVLYHTEGNAPLLLVVLKKNKDGTVNIGPDGGPAIVTNCPIVDEPKPGYATVVVESEPEKSTESK